MTLGRLFRMSLPELSGRGRQAARKRVDRLVQRRPAGDGLRPAAIHLTERIHEAMPRRFFAGAGAEATLPVVAERMPEVRARVVARADAVATGRFDLLGYRELEFGNPIDWHLDPVSGRRSPLLHWTRLDPLDPATVGDSKVVWELNRHQWLVQLGQAYRLTGEARYAEAFAGAVRAWCRANPVGLGINWTSSLEVALRLIAWTWALVLFRDATALSGELFPTMVAAVEAHARHVERYLSYYFSPNTHLTGEALGLFYAGVVFAELPGARRWRALGARVLADESGRQILDDGVYFEHATGYQRYTVEIYLHLLVLAARNGIGLPRELEERVHRLLDFLLAIRRPDGSVPQMGDGDGGRVVDLVRRDPEDFRGVFAVAAAHLGRADCAWAAGEPAPETAWLLGSAGVAAFDRLHSAPPAGPPSRLFPQGGYVVMRSDWSARAHQLVFDVGPLACPPTGGHGHADLLAVQCAIFGVPYLIDAGTYCYTPDPRWRDHFRSTAAHSSVVVDGESQARPRGPFGWAELPQARLLRWDSTDAVDVAEAEHAAYGRLADPVVHRRRVVFIRPRHWVLVDELAGSAEHRVEVRFQFAPMDVSLGTDGWVRARSRAGHALLLRAFAAVPLKTDIVEGELDPVNGWVSPDYGRRVPAPMLIHATTSRLPLRIATLLVPLDDGDAPAPRVAVHLDDAGVPVALSLGDGPELVRLI